MEKASVIEGEGQGDWSKRVYAYWMRLDAPERLANCMLNAGIETLEQSLEVSDEQLLRTPNFGRKSLNSLYEITSWAGLKRIGTKPKVSSFTSWHSKPSSPRNVQIFVEWEAGAKMTDLARKHGLSAPRVAQIIHGMERRIERGTLSRDWLRPDATFNW